MLIDKVESICERNGLRNDSIVMRMTGCPNGCARPYVAGPCNTLLSGTRSNISTEVAFVGKAAGTYSMLLGGGYYGQRMNKIYRGKFDDGWRMSEANTDVNIQKRSPSLKYWPFWNR